MIRNSPMLDEAMSANEFAKLVYDISQQLKHKNVEALKYIYGVCEEGISNLKVLQILESRGVFSPSNIQGLEKVFRDIDRCDLLEMLRETEQDKRLKLCYYQALSIQEQLEAIITELLKFSAKQECSPTERTFCSKIAERVQRADKEMKEFLIQPLNEVTTESKTHSLTGENVCISKGVSSTKFHDRTYCLSIDLHASFWFTADFYTLPVY